MPGQQTRGRRYDIDTGGKPTATDERNRHRERRKAAKERDAPYEAAYEAGRRGDDPAEYQTSDQLWATYQDGQQAAKAEQRQGRRDSRREHLGGQLAAGGAKASSVANDGAGVLLGFVAYALLVNWLRHGPAGTKGWLAAKFLNRPAALAKPAPKGAQSGGGGGSRKVL